MAARWLDPRDGEKLLAALGNLSPEGAALAEKRLIAPWQRRARKLERRNAAIMALARTYVAPSGREIARLMLFDLRRPPADAARRQLIDQIVRAGKLPSYGTLRRTLSGLAQNQGTIWATGFAQDVAAVSGGAQHGVGTGGRKGKARSAGRG